MLAKCSTTEPYPAPETFLNVNIGSLILNGELS